MSSTMELIQFDIYIEKFILTLATLYINSDSKCERKIINTLEEDLACIF